LPFVSKPEHALPLLGMLSQAQLSIEDLLGQISKGFIEQLLVLSAQQVAGAKHPGRHVGDVSFPRFFTFQPVGIMPPIPVHADC